MPPETLPGPDGAGSPAADAGGPRSSARPDGSLLPDRPALRAAGIPAAAALLAAALLAGGASPLAAQEDPSRMQVDSMHLEALEYPSANQCAECHPRQYRQWSMSPHAYAQLSPVYNSFQATQIKLNNGTTGDFCIRCHNATGMSKNEPVFTNNANRDPVSREGVTCITCHRMNKDWGKFSARFRIVPGDIYGTIYGPSDGSNFDSLQQDPSLRLATERDQNRRRALHLDVEPFFEMTEPAMCGTCHDVLSPGGFRLEEAFSEYKSSPAARRGVSCQDCHMGKTPGEFTGDPATNYATGPAARVGGDPTPPRKATDHSFAGPDHSIIHPGVFPHDREMQEFATMEAWLQFDWTAGWGTPAFEDTVSEDYEFPERWSFYTDRLDARFYLEQQFEKLNEYAKKRRTVLRNGYQIGEIKMHEVSADGISFEVEVENATDGHNVPTGFIAERPVYLRVIVQDASGDTVFISGDLDANGDLRDSHSILVHAGKAEPDPYLFNLQSEFTIQMIRGGEREQVLAVNQSIDPLPFGRPSASPTVLRGHPGGARIHRRGIEPNGSRWPEYEVSGEKLAGTEGPYRATVKLISGMVPVNLIGKIQKVGFDYGMSAREVAERIVAGHAVLWKYGATFELGQDPDEVEWEKRDPPPATWLNLSPAGDEADDAN